MKEIIAIIRPKKVGATRKALEVLGFPSQTASAVMGRGRQRGIASEVETDLSPDALARGKGSAMKYVPKRMLNIVVPDSEVDAVLAVIVRVNQTSQIGDGKIFVCPMESALRVRTGETGEQAI